jgi:hypothetical protein
MASLTPFRQNHFDPAQQFLDARHFKPLAFPHRVRVFNLYVIWRTLRPAVYAYLANTPTFLYAHHRL